jgi:hypothetical protein
MRRLVFTSTLFSTGCVRSRKLTGTKATQKQHPDHDNAPVRLPVGGTQRTNVAS